MKRFLSTPLQRLCLLTLLLVLASLARAQEGLHIAPLFEKYGSLKDVTRVELNGSILKSYRMTAYKSLVFKDVSPYRQEIQKALSEEKLNQVEKTQEVVEGGTLISAYYQLSDTVRKGRRLKRYILFKSGKEEAATLIYIEGTLSEQELMQMLYKQK